MNSISEPTLRHLFSIPSKYLNAISFIPFTTFLLLIFVRPSGITMSSTNYYEQIQETTAYLQAHGISAPHTGIVLGTGLSHFLQHIEVHQSIEYTDIPHFPQATVEFHKGRLIYGHVSGVPVLAMQGRFHLYEGYSARQVTFPIRVMHALGIQQLFLSNAAGGINKAFKKGDLVLLNDHINLQTDNPLTGLTNDKYGPRFPDMSDPYDPNLCSRLHHIAGSQNIILKEGVYAAVNGPNLETRAEYRYLRTIGADLVGMSTVPEVIVAAQCGIPCAAISVITDECDPDNLQPIKIEEIIAIAASADKVLSKLFTKALTYVD